MSKRVKVIISPDGSVKLDAIGYQGKGCEKVTKLLAGAVGKAEDEGKKPGWSMPEPSMSTVQEGQEDG